MLIKQHDNNLKSQGLGAGGDFKIAATSKAFEILSSNLYQNKILAVIRETSCNAVDAHALSGEPISRIEVTLPTWGSPTYSIRDYGPGLSKDAMFTLYTTFFLSDKDKTNDLIGGLGLGSKVGFAVADQFTVISWHGGFKRTYVCYKNNGIPAINLVSETPSTEDTGICVSIAVSSTRFGDWATEAHNYFRWWLELPTFHPTPLDMTPLFESKHYLVNSDTLLNGRPLWHINSKLSTPVAYMGMVPYSINLHNLLELPSEVREVFNSVGLVLVFNIGDLDINPSRETLSYNPATCKALCTRIATIHKTIRTEIEARLASAPTLYDARCLYFGTDATSSTNFDKFLGELSKKVGIKNMSATWNGKPILATIKCDLEDAPNFDPKTNLSTMSKNYWRKVWTKRTLVAADGYVVTHYWPRTGYSEDTTFYAHTSKPITAKTYRIVQYYLETEVCPKFSTRRNIDVVIISNCPRQPIEDALEEAGFPSLLDIDTMPIPPAVASTSTASQITKTTGYLIRNNSYTRTEQELDLSFGGYYIPFFDGTPKQNLTCLTTIKDLLLYPNKCDTMLGFAERRLKVASFVKLLTKKGWSELTYDSLKEVPPSKLRTLVCGYKLRNSSYSNSVSTKLPPNFQLFTWALPPTLVAVPPEWHTFATKLAEVEKLPFLSPVWETLTSYLTDDQTKAIVAGTQDAETFIQAMHSFYQKHPLLAGLNLHEKIAVQDVLDYLNR